MIDTCQRMFLSPAKRKSTTTSSGCGLMYLSTPRKIYKDIRVKEHRKNTETVVKEKSGYASNM